MSLRRGLRLVPVAAGAWAVAAVSLIVPQTAGWLALGLWLAAAGTVGAALLRRRGGAALVVIVLTLAVAAAVASQVAAAQPARAAAAAVAVDGGRAIDVSAVVTGKPAPTATGRLRFDAQASRIAAGDAGRSVDVPIVVLGQLPAPLGLDVGATVVASGTAFRADVSDRAVLVVDSSRGLRVQGPAQGPLGVAAELRSGLVAAVAGLPEPGAGLVPGLAVGDTAAVSPELDSAMKQSSLSHLTAVSGANCAIVVGLAFGLAALCGARRGVRVFVSLAVLTGFVVLVTPEPSVVRAAAMAAVAMLGVALGRTATGVSLLCVAVACALVGDPWLAASLGFALSVAATASLLTLALPLATGMQRVMPRALALVLAVPVAAQLACGPLLVLIEPTLPLYGVVANLLAGPAAPAATVIGLATCLAAPIPLLQAGLAALAWLPAAWIAGTAQTTAALPGAQVPWLDGIPGLTLLALIGAAVALLVIGATGRVLGHARTAAGALVAVAVGIGAGIGALHTVAGPLTVPPDWAMIACDVGQGDAVLLRSADRIALVDTGPDPEPLRTCLSRLGVAHVDLLVLTHFDADHVGGVAAVTGLVGTVLHGPAADVADRMLLDRLADSGAEVVEAYEGMTGDLGAATWRVVWPPQRSAAFPSGNDASVVLDVRGGIPPTLLLGDLGASAQRALVASDALAPPYALVKVAHHGSADQDAGLYRLARGAVAVVSAGRDNDYGHPRAEALRMLEDAGALIVRTDTEGMVAFVAGRAGVSVWRERAPPGVGPDG